MCLCRFWGGIGAEPVTRAKHALVREVSSGGCAWRVAPISLAPSYRQTNLLFDRATQNPPRAARGPGRRSYGPGKRSPAGLRSPRASQAPTKELGSASSPGQEKSKKNTMIKIIHNLFIQNWGCLLPCPLLHLPFPNDPHPRFFFSCSCFNLSVTQCDMFDFLVIGFKPLCPVSSCPVIWAPSLSSRSEVRKFYLATALLAVFLSGGTQG